jgi:hypothetical protein
MILLKDAAIHQRVGLSMMKLEVFIHQHILAVMNTIENALQLIKWQEVNVVSVSLDGEGYIVIYHYVILNVSMVNVSIKILVNAILVILVLYAINVKIAILLSIAICPNCTNGVCLSNTHCECYSGFKGSGCEEPERTPFCVHGVASTSFSCLCDPGWTGELCEISNKHIT